jgi:hypothetical protein
MTIPAGLDRSLFPPPTRLEVALSRTPWAMAHRRQVTLTDGGMVIARAQRYDLAGRLDQQPIRIVGLGDVSPDPAGPEGTQARALIEREVSDASQGGADIALLFLSTAAGPHPPDGFDVVPTMDLELEVAVPERRGAPMTLVRDGADRDLAAIAAMGDTRASAFRFHLTRDVEFVKYAITRSRIAAGVAPAGSRQVRFVIAEEGITAAAYAVLTIRDRIWTLEECGDRDASGARVGAILQALIACDPAEQRPTIRAWLPPGFVPPQVAVVSTVRSAHVVLIRSLRTTLARPRLSKGDVLCWRNDLF